MRTYARYAFSIGAAAVLLAGCGGSPVPTGAPGAMSQTRTAPGHVEHGGSWMLPRTGTEGLPFIKEYVIKNPHLVQPMDLAFDASNNLWFNTFYYYLGRRGPEGSITAHFLGVHKPYGSGWGWMTVGPKGEVYFTDYYGGNVGKIEPGGKIALYFRGQTSWKAGLVFTHGHIWVVLPGYLNSVVWKLSVDGKIVKQIVLPGNYCYAEPIAASADGTLWIGYSGNCPAIVRVTETGQTTEFPITAADGVWSVVSGPDGNIWFTAADGPTTNDYVGKITPSGQITKYPLSNQADGIALGPDGNWWITMPFVGKIAVMSLQGNMLNEYTLPHAVKGSQPRFQLDQIVLGRDGNLWFAEGYRNKIGELKF